MAAGIKSERRPTSNPRPDCVGIRTDDLRHGRLPHINDRRAGEMISGDFGAHCRLPCRLRLPASVRRAPRAEGRPAFRSAPLCSAVLGAASAAEVRVPARVVFDPGSFSSARIASFASEGRHRDPHCRDLPPVASMVANAFNASMLTSGEQRLMPAQYLSSNIQIGSSRARSGRSSV